jgi:hypothetical protein
VKSIFALLVLANVGLLMWASWYRDPQAGPRPRPAVHADRLVPLAAPGVTPRPRPEGVAPGQALEAVDPEPRAAGSADCIGFGPYETRVLAARAADRVAALGIRNGLVIRTRKVGSGYRVFQPPRPSRNEAEQHLAELRALGVRDIQLVTDPGYENSISFGVFSQRRNAERLKAQLAQRGIEAMIEPYRRTRREYWLSLESGAPDPRQRAELERVSHGARLEVLPCDVIAGGNRSAPVAPE